MRWLEVRRHPLTKKGTAAGRGSHLSAEGVALARRSLGPFALVVTSASPRAVETAVAMGFAVDETVELPSGSAPGGSRSRPACGAGTPGCWGAQVGWSGVAEAHRVLWARVVQAVPDGAAAWWPACRMSTTGRGARRLAAATARLGFDEGRFVGVRFRRAPAGGGQSSSAP